MIEHPVPGVPDACIRMPVLLPATLPGAVACGARSVGKPGALLRVVHGLARYLVLDGVTIEVAPDAGASSIDVDTFLYGSVLAALILQRGELPLHAATLVPPGGGKTVSLVGDSGTGKSTTAFALIQRGWTLMSEDVTRVTVTGDRLLAWPGRDLIKLGPHSCHLLGIAPVEMMSDADGKFLIPVAASRQPAEVGAIVCVRRDRDGAVSAVDRAAAMRLVTVNIHCARYMDALGRTADQLRIALEIISRVRFCRVGDSGSPATLADRISAELG